MDKVDTFSNLAKYYDLIYLFKDYRAEVMTLEGIISKYKKSGGVDLLDVACGTGKHLKYFNPKYSITGVDLNAKMLKIAKENHPKAYFKQADMTNFNFNKEFDVVTCLFSSIGYLKNYTNLKAAIKNFSLHLKKGGVVIVEPWFTLDSYISGLPSMTVYDGEDVKISRLCVCKKKGILSVMDMHYLVAEKNKDVKHYLERHELALFDKEKILSIMEQQGLYVKFITQGLMPGRGLYIGVKI